MSATSAELARGLQHLRTMANISIRDLADLSGAGAKPVQAVLHGRNVTLLTADRVCRVFNSPVGHAEKWTVDRVIQLGRQLRQKEGG